MNARLSKPEEEEERGRASDRGREGQRGGEGKMEKGVQEICESLRERWGAGVEYHFQEI